MFQRVSLVFAVLLLPVAAHAQTPTLAPPPPVSIAPVPPEKPRFANEIAAFEAGDAIAMPAKGGVLFLGSSSIRMWRDLARDFPGVPVINRGFGGSMIEDSVRYVDRIVTPYAPSTIVFYAGDNDLQAGHSPRQLLSDFRSLVAKVHRRLPATRILFVAIKPSIARWRLIDDIRAANALVRDYAATDQTLDFVDIFPAMLGPDGKPRPEYYRGDGLHMTRAGYDIWRAEVAKALTASPRPAPLIAPAPSSPVGR